MSIPLIPLNDGHAIPQIGLGTWPLRGEEAAATVATAIELGYRHIDTAMRYENEEGVGEGARRSGIARRELFVTTKLDGEFQGGDRAIEGLVGSLKRLGFDYVDLLLIHWPLPKRGEFVSTWRTFEKLKAEGLARSIGVSNFKSTHLEVLADATQTVPAVNQIELTPVIPRHEYRAYNAAHGIVTEAWSPLGPGNGLLALPELATIGAKYGKTPAQVVIRWHVQNRIVVIPKSKNRERLAENLDVFDFELDADDLELLAEVDGGPNVGADSDQTGH